MNVKFPKAVFFVGFCFTLFLPLDLWNRCIFILERLTQGHQAVCCIHGQELHPLWSLAHGCLGIHGTHKAPQLVSAFHKALLPLPHTPLIPIPVTADHSPFLEYRISCAVMLFPSPTYWTILQDPLLMSHVPSHSDVSLSSHNNPFIAVSTLPLSECVTCSSCRHEIIFSFVSPLPARTNNSEPTAQQLLVYSKMTPIAFLQKA